MPKTNGFIVYEGTSAIDAALGWMWWSLADAMDKYDDWNDYQ